MTKFLNISTDTNLGGNDASDDVVSSQKAIKVYIDAQSGGGGTSYTAGTGIDITNGVISITNPTQTTTNLVTSISSSSTNAQYPSAKCVYDIVGDIETALHAINSGGVQTATLTVRVYDYLRQFDSFTINEETYTDFLASGDAGELKIKDINIPINTDLPWSASAKTSYKVTPASGTLNISSDYILELAVEIDEVIGPV